MNAIDKRLTARRQSAMDRGELRRPTSPRDPRTGLKLNPYQSLIEEARAARAALAEELASVDEGVARAKR